MRRALGLGALLAALAAPAAHAAPVPRPGAPISSHAMVHTCCAPLAMKERIFAESKAMGARFIRVDVELHDIFRHPGEDPRWERLDEVLELSRRHELPVLGILMSTPPWLAACPAGPGAVRCPPDDMDEFGRLAGEVAEHARDTILHWEVVNEPDGTWAFEGTAEDYARMLRAAHDGIEARAPGARIALGGLMTPREPAWLERVLATPGADAVHAFDIANLHLRGQARWLPAELAAWRDLLGRHGFGGPVWVTEHGYPADPAFQSDPAFRGDGAEGGEQTQASYLTESVLALAEAGAGEVFVTLRDNLDGAFASEGVVALGGAPGYDARRKPSFAAVRRLVDRWDELIAMRAEQRAHEAAARSDQGLAAAARADVQARRLVAEQARWKLLMARLRHRFEWMPRPKARLRRRLERAQLALRTRQDETAWARALARIYETRAAQHVQRAGELADAVAGR